MNRRIFIKNADMVTSGFGLATGVSAGNSLNFNNNPFSCWNGYNQPEWTLSPIFYQLILN